jgi:hypothetical protein
MKRILHTFLLLVLPLLTMGQTFTFTQSGGIPDNGVQVCFPLQVNGILNQTDSTFGLTGACINITHTYVSDLEIELHAPDGTIISLCNRHGGGGDNFVATCFSMAASISIINASAPYTGTFLPETSLNAANNTGNPNGIWSLCVRDAIAADAGILNNFSITFGPNPPADPAGIPGVCSTTNALGCLCPDSTSNCDLLPDMISSAPIIAQQHAEFPGRIEMANATPNIGWGPLEVHGTGQCFCDTVQVSCSTTACPDGSQPKQLIKQRVYHKNNGQMTYIDRPAGFMSYHPSHGHVHVDNWASFSLRTPTSNPDASTWPIVGTGQKVSFCLINLGNCSNNVGWCVDTSGAVVTMADIPNAGFGSVSGCGNDQGIFTGHLDIYGMGLPGMWIDLPPNVCNGDYYIVSITDPDNNFLETDETNNWVAVPITLTQQVQGATATFIYSQTNGLYGFAALNVPAGSTFTWDFGDGSVDSVSNPAFHTYLTPGAHTVTLTVEGPCGIQTSSQTFTVLGKADELLNPNFSLKSSPNPASARTIISYSLPKRQQAAIEVYNMLGQRVKNLKQGLQEEGEQQFLLDFDEAGLPVGAYVIWLKTDQGSTAIRVVRAE